METSSHDILLVGGGGAALRAAIAVSEINPKLSVAVVSKVYPMRSHTVSAEGGAAGVIGEDDTLDEHAYDTISGGDWLSDQDCVEIFVNEIPKELLRLENWGCPWSRRDDGKVAVRPFGGMKKMRTWFAADKTGFHMLHTLFQTSLRYPLTRYDETFVTKLMVEGDRVCGVVAIELKTGKVRVITAKAVIICTGGCGRVFPYTTNANICTGDGMALAYRASAPLKDMEMVQYHPTGLPFTGILITEAARAEGGLLSIRTATVTCRTTILANRRRSRFCVAWNLDPATACRRRSSRRWRRAHYKGPIWRRGSSRSAPSGRGKINAKLPMVRELCVKYENIDPVNEMIPVRPVQHYMMGGVHTDTSGATPLKGLYAAGEAACVSINGANRLGSNSLSEFLVFGARAGRAAAEYASQVAMPSAERDPRAGCGRGTSPRNEYLKRPGGPKRFRHCAKRCRIRWKGAAGIYRDAQLAGRAANKISEMKERLQASRSRITPGLQHAADCGARTGLHARRRRTILHARLNREESRGAHQRRDFPERDDNKFLAHSLVSRSRRGRRSRYRPVRLRAGHRASGCTER